MCQALETGQRQDDQVSHEELENRKLQDEQNSQDDVEHLNENLADFEEEEKSRECNYNMADATD